MDYANNNFNKAIGQRLRELRKKNKLTVAALVDKLMQKDFFVDERTIRRYEKGEYLPKLEILLYLAEVFETSLDYIVAGKKMSDDNSLTYYDNFKRLNRLIYSMSVTFLKDDATGKCYLELWEDASKIYWEKLQSFGLSENFLFENNNKDPYFSLEELDALIADFAEYKQQLLPSKERLDLWLTSQGVDPDLYLLEKLKRIKR